MIVRELVALLGLEVDERQFEKADRRFEGLKRGAAALGAVLVSGVVARGLASFVKQASDVEEADNVLKIAFDQSADSVREWAATTAGQVKRSEHVLTGLAGQVGAVAQSMFGAGEETAKLSMDMAQLAVDLGSVFNTSDNEALIALKAALVGETEPMRRFGVTLTQAALQEFALSQGIGKTVLSMTEAEKMQLRYNFILAKTTRFQGDATRTGDAFANSYKFLWQRANDLAIKIGQALLPAATKLVHIATSIIDRFMLLARNTKVLETGLVVLGTIAAAVGAAMLAPFLPAILAAGALTAAVGAVILVVEDLYQFITGGRSVTERALRRMGLDVERVRGFFVKLGQAASRIWSIITDRVGVLASKIGVDLGGAVDWLAGVLQRFFDWAEPKLDALLSMDVEKMKAQVADFFDNFSRHVAAFIHGPMGKMLLSLLGGEGGSIVGSILGAKLGSKLGPLGGLIGGLAGAAGGSFVGEKAGSWLSNKAFEFSLKPGTQIVDLGRIGGGVQPSPHFENLGRLGGGNTVNFKIDSTVNGAAGQDPVAIAAEVTKQVSAKLEAEYSNAWASHIPLNP